MPEMANGAVDVAGLQQRPSPRPLGDRGRDRVAFGQRPPHRPFRGRHGPARVDVGATQRLVRLLQHRCRFHA